VRKYTLNRAFKIVLRVESTPLQAEAFSDICDKNRVIALIYGIYTALPTVSLKACAVLLYGAKCFLSFRDKPMRKAQIAAAGTFVNEKRVVCEFQRLAKSVDVRSIELSNWHSLSIESWLALLHILPRTRNLYRLCRRLAARYDFMPSCRSLSVIAYGIRMHRVLAEHTPAAALIPSSYAPDSMALAFAAHKCGAKVIYTNHAHAAPLFDYIAPIHADLSILTGRAVFETYSRRSHVEGDVVYKGFLSEERPIAATSLQDRARKLTVGIFLTSLTDMPVLQTFARSLVESLALARIVIRPHPVALLRDDFAGLCARVSEVEVEPGGSLIECAKSCDLVVCGNSSAVLEVLKAGVPVAYNGSLDRAPDDYCGFVSAGLIPRCPDDLEALPRALVDFYRQENWIIKMRYFDDSYGKNLEMVRAEVEKFVESCVR